MATRYWAGNGKYQAVYNELNKLIPSMGPVAEARGANRKLEKLRVAANCYYDLFNNGLCNRAAEFRRVFGFGGKVIADSHYSDRLPQSKLLEETMDKIIYDAAVEQQLHQYLTTSEEKAAT